MILANSGGGVRRSWGEWEKYTEMAYLRLYILLHDECNSMGGKALIDDTKGTLRAGMGFFPCLNDINSDSSTDMVHRDGFLCSHKSYSRYVT
jgi:hypothetical protein